MKRLALLARGGWCFMLVLSAALVAATTGSVTISESTPLGAVHVGSGVDPTRMVLRVSDLPQGFALDRGYYADNVRAAKESDTPLALYVRWGRINGYEADYVRPGTGGLVEVRSVASLYKTAKGAAASVHYSFSQAGPVFTGTKIGDESRLYTTTVSSQGVTMVAYAIFWRYRTVKAGVVAAGYQGTVRPADAVALARRQQARIAISAT